jgi:hypothetical protein
VVPPPTNGDGTSERQEVCTEELLIASGETIICGDDMIDVALASRRGGTIDRDNLCGLLADCLQDVRFIVLVMLYLFTLLLDFYFSLPL